MHSSVISGALLAALSSSAVPLTLESRQTVPQANLSDATQQIENVYATAIGRDSNSPNEINVQNQDPRTRICTAPRLINGFPSRAL